MGRFKEKLMGAVLLAGLILSVTLNNGWWFGGAVVAMLLIAFLGPRANQDAEPQLGAGMPDESVLLTQNANRDLAVKLVELGGYPGISAQGWLRAFDADPTVPPFGVRPYWTASGPGGTPRLVSFIGVQGVEDRLQYIRESDADDTLLPIMADDPSPRVRQAARSRMQ